MSDPIQDVPGGIELYYGEPSPRTYDECMKWMSSYGGGWSEHAFCIMQSMAHEHVDRLIADFYSDDETLPKYWLLELIEDSKSPKAIPVFIDMLDSEEYGFRTLAASTLISLDTDEMDEILISKLRPQLNSQDEELAEYAQDILWAMDTDQARQVLSDAGRNLFSPRVYEPYPRIDIHRPWNRWPT